MKRRTNLFYTGTNITESNFLTFSNYTEHLTGVALANEFKLFPSQFLCFNIPALKTKEDKEYFIKNYLIGYYENKLAFLRDNCFANDNEDTIYPDRALRYLAYLIDAIMKFDSTSTLVYKSKITEQDYNGTFTDIICTIDSSSSIKTGYKLTKIEDINDLGNVNIPDISLKDYLYGWVKELIYDSEDTIEIKDNNDNSHYYEWVGPSVFKDVKPKFDNDEELFEDSNENPKYYINTFYSCDNNATELLDSEELVFNVIIPLYDIVHFNPTTNSIILPNDEESFEEHPIDYVPKYNDEHAINVPYGIWFANEEIILKRADFKKYAPSWSLLIGTQFKPFPNSEYLVPDSNTDSKMGGFVTFAQVLSKHNEMLNKIEDYVKYINDLKLEVVNKKQELDQYISKMQSMENRLAELESKLNKISLDSSNKHVWTIK